MTGGSNRGQLSTPHPLVLAFLVFFGFTLGAVFGTVGMESASIGDADPGCQCELIQDDDSSMSFVYCDATGTDWESDRVYLDNRSVSAND